MVAVIVATGSKTGATLGAITDLTYPILYSMIWLKALPINRLEPLTGEEKS